jgi:polar amino acid transport system substrate-binding protein
LNNYKYLIIILLSHLVISSHADADTQSYEPLVMGVPEFKPYTYLHNGKIIGSAIKQSVPIFSDLKVNTAIKHYENYSLLLKALKNNEINGFFLASQNTERDRHAEFSQPVTFNNWSWFSLKQKKFQYDSGAFKGTATVATIGKTNTFRWLTRNGYQVHSTSISQLPSLLLNKQVDAVFSAESVFLQACKDSEVNINGFNTHIAAKRPFGIYISKQYLGRNKGFMKHLNRIIKNTNKGTN